jgi:hypothetical protein
VIPVEIASKEKFFIMKPPPQDEKYKKAVQSVLMIPPNFQNTDATSQSGCTPRNMGS